MTSPTYLIVEPIELIATDLALSVQDYDAAAIVLTAVTQKQALAVLADKALVEFAFIHADPTGFATTDLGKALAARGTVCVFMGHAADIARKALIVLERPFSPETIAELLTQLKPPKAARAPAGRPCWAMSNVTDAPSLRQRFG